MLFRMVFVKIIEELLTGGGRSAVPIVTILFCESGHCLMISESITAINQRGVTG